MADEADQMALLGAQVEDEYDTRWSVVKHGEITPYPLTISGK